MIAGREVASAQLEQTIAAWLKVREVRAAFGQALLLSRDCTAMRERRAQAAAAGHVPPELAQPVRQQWEAGSDAVGANQISEGELIVFVAEHMGWMSPFSTAARTTPDELEALVIGTLDLPQRHQSMLARATIEQQFAILAYIHSNRVAERRAVTVAEVLAACFPPGESPQGWAAQLIGHYLKCLGWVRVRAAGTADGVEGRHWQWVQPGRLTAAAWRDELVAYLQRNKSRPRFSVAEIMVECFDLNLANVNPHGLEAIRIGRFLAECGWQKQRIAAPTRAWVWARPRHDA